MTAAATIENPPWTTTQLEAITGFVTAGAPIPQACQAAGVKWSTAKNWITRGKKGCEPYVRFVEALVRARAVHKVGLALVISGAAERGDWRAAAYLLERESMLEKRMREQRERAESAEPAVLMYPVAVPPGAALPEQTRLPDGRQEFAERNQEH